MRDQLLYASGGIAISVAIIHAYLGETAIFRKATIEPARTALLLRLVWFAGAVAWAVLGTLLIICPTFQSEAARMWITAMAALAFFVAAAANAIATRGRHPGWILMFVASIAALSGH